MLKIKPIIIYILIGYTGILSAQININSYFKKGRYHLINEEYTEAIKAFNQIIIYNPEFEEAYLLRGYAKLQLSDILGSIEDFNKTLSLNQYNTDALYYRALSNIEQKKHKDALMDLISAIEMDDRYPEYFITRGWLHSYFSDTIGAINDYKKALKIDSNNIGANINLALLYTSSQMHEEALIISNKICTLQPESKYCYYSKAQHYFFKSDYFNALKEFENVLKRDSTDVQCQFLSALCQRNLKNYQSALEKLNIAISLNPNNAIFYYHKGIIYLEINNTYKSIEELNKALNITKDNIYLYFVRGIAYMEIKKFSVAEADFSKVISLYPFFADAYVKRSYVRLQQNNYTGFLQDKATVDSIRGNSLIPNAWSMDYLKSITNFNTDFTSIQLVNESKIQYNKNKIEILPPFNFSLQDTDNSSYLHKTSSTTKQVVTQKSEFQSVLKLAFNANNKKDSVIIQIEEEDISSDLKGKLVDYIQMVEQKKYFEALRFIEDLILENPDSYLLYFLRGNINLFLSSYTSKMAGHSMRINSEFSPSDEQSEISIEKLYIDMALKDFQTSLKINDKKAFIWYNTAYVYFVLEDYENAIKYYSQCYTIDGTLKEALYNCGLLKIIQGNNNDGCLDLSKAGELGLINSYSVIYKYCNKIL